ncbi:MAG: Penicillin acylase precursor [Clostridia bacterium]|jgi:hypothetical protein|nr:Penicillin acylase precursor [Clostridia bacterium]
MKSKNRIILIGIVLVIAAVLAAAGCGESITAFIDKGLSADEKATLESVEKIDDYPLYVMYYKGDYGFDRYINKGRKQDDAAESQSDSYACSTVYSYDEKNGSYFGRNMDWYKHPLLLLFTDSPKGNASVCMVDISYLGFDSKDDITKMTLEERKALLDAPYIPFDGMNEYGVCISEMSLYGPKPIVEPGKVALSPQEVMRAVLDYAKNTQEAIEIFKKYNMVYGKKVPYMHFMVADPAGESAILEHIDGKLQITKNTENWQICTNSQIYENTDEVVMAECWRYREAYERLHELQNAVKREDVAEIMQDVSVPSTIWTSLFDMNTGDIEIFAGRKYDSGKRFKLPLKK